MKNTLAGTFIVVCFIAACYIVGSVLGWAIDHWAVKRPHTVWYCIEGQVHERIDNFYVTVSPPRICVPADKD